MGRRALLLIASILVAATGTGVVALYATRADTRAVDQQSAKPVLFATTDIPLGATGDQLTAAVKSKGFASELIPQRSVGSTAQLTGLAALVAITKGQPLDLSMFGKPGQGSAGNELGLEKSKVAVAVVLPDSARVAGFVEPESYVALFVTSGGKDAGAKGEIRVLVNTPVRVLKVALSGAKVPTPEQTLVTLQLDPKDAPRVIYASQKDTLYMALLESKDASVAGITPFSGDYTGSGD